MCWASCDRLAKIASTLQLVSQATHWRRRADEIRARILECAWNERLKSFVATFEGEGLDATLLLIPVLGFLPASDPRFVSTVEAIGQQLKVGNLLLRYASADDFGKPSTGFVVCTFWYVDALHAMGRTEEARSLFENVLRLRNAFGLYSEDVDLDTGELWGNFPQTYSLVGLINSAMRLSKAGRMPFSVGIEASLLSIILGVTCLIREICPYEQSRFMSFLRKRMDGQN